MIPDLDWFRLRVVQDCLNEAHAATWLRRAKAFEDAAPRAGDFHGKATPDELRDRYDRCMAAVAACRHHAGLVGYRGQDIEDDVRETIEGVAA